MSIRVLAALVWLTAICGSIAHPVAQGAMEILVEKERVHVLARVSVEQAFVAEGLGESRGPADLNTVWQNHGSYLLSKLQIEADGVAVQGQVLRVTPPLSTAPSVRIGYELSFPLGQPPSRVVIRQNLLNEIQFAVGNPWEATFVTTLRQAGREAHAGLLFTHKEPLTMQCEWDQPVAAVSQAPTIDRGQMFAEYFRHGVHHILAGYDHLLFMAALVLGIVSLLDLVKVVTAFTVAHTVTLTLSVLDVFRLPSGIVEPMIAASIVVVALQTIFWPSQSRGWPRLALAFGFGLFHGLGFAGGLLEAMADLPGVAVATAIVAFSIGVEAGHQVLVLPLFGLFAWVRARSDVRPPQMPLAVRLASGGISFAGMYYLVLSLR